MLIWVFVNYVHGVEYKPCPGFTTHLFSTPCPDSQHIYFSFPSALLFFTSLIIYRHQPFTLYDPAYFYLFTFQLDQELLILFVLFWFYGMSPKARLHAPRDVTYMGKTGIRIQPVWVGLGNVKWVWVR